MDLEEYARQVRKGGQGQALEKLASSAQGERLLEKVDREALEKAARAGDMKALGGLMRDILATPEGRAFAAQVEKAVKRDGR